MQLKYKFVLLTVVPLLAAIAAVAGIVAYKTRVLEREQAQIIEARFLASKRAELQHYLGLAMSSIGHLYGAGRTDAEARERARQILGDMNFGDDGYFFAYDTAGNNVVHPRKPDLVGRNLWNHKDPKGNFVIQSLLQAAREGDGFARYQWEKPSTHQMTEKLGYVVMLDRWGWMLGTGIYLDDLEQTMSSVRNEVSESISATMAAIAYVAVIAALLVFAGGLALSVTEHRLADAKLKQLAQDIVRLQEVERARVSRELHDGISQLLVSIKFHFELAQEKLRLGSGDPQPDLAKGVGGLTDAIAEVRRISHDLRPSLLDDLGLAAAIKQLGNEFAARTGIRTQTAEIRDDLPVEGDPAVTLFRIAQEALTNIERHARATSIDLALGTAQDGRQICLRISDDGRGFDTRAIDDPANSGIGLRNIRERVEHQGGTLAIASRPGQTVLTVTLPVPSIRARPKS